MKKTTTRENMQQALIVDNSRIAAVVERDLGDKKSWLCRLERDGTKSLSRSISTSRAALTRSFTKQPRGNCGQSATSKADQPIFVKE